MMYLIVITNDKLQITYSDKSYKSVSFIISERKDTKTQSFCFMNTDCTDLRDYLAYARD